jgi:mannose-1-phosphate guanylyltransferase
MMVENLYPVILSGGRGERFWPLSTPENPKPFLQFFSDHSLLQQTFDRARLLAQEDHILLVIGEQHEKLSRQQLPQLKTSQILLEPVGRDTAAAIGYASLQLPADGLMLVMPADHLIPDPYQFAATVAGAAAIVNSQGGLGTFGIKPDRPETNYGYIHSGSRNLGTRDFPVYPVDRFVEKPDLASAKKYVRQTSYYWNSGIFLWKVSRIRELLAKFLPELWSGLQRLKDTKNKQEFQERYEALPRISIDFGVMEKAEGVIVIPASFKWDDIGTWNSLLRILSSDADGNLTRGNHVSVETKNSIVYADDHLIATAGVRDLVIVQHGNQILICSRDYADRLKDLLAKIPSSS